MIELAGSGWLTQASFEAQLTVSFGARERRQVGAVVGRP